MRLKEPGQDVRTILGRINAGLQGVPQAFAFALPPPPIQGIGNVGGFSMQVEIRNGNFDYALLQNSHQHRRRGRQRAIRRFAGRHDIPRGRAAISSSCRPHQGGDARDHRRPGVLRPLRLCGLELCRPDQQVRPRLPGLYASGGQVSRQRRRHSQPQGQSRQRNDDADRHRDRGQARTGPALISLYNLYPTATVVGSAGARFQLGPGARHHGAGRQSDALPTGTGFEWTAHVLPGEAGRQPDLLRLRLRAPARLFRAGGTV